jgi:DNA-binding LacI/PurR family transcriptional regulator
MEPAYRQMLAERAKMPVVYLDFYDHTNYADAVVSNGYYGMYTVTNYLIAMGHRDIVFVGTVGATSSISDRFFGFWRAMAEHNIPVTPESCMRDRADQAADGLINLELPARLPTAFACNCDTIAYRLIQLLTAQGLRVPEDVSVAGFDNAVVSALCVPAITTYAVDMEGMAFACVNNLIQKILHKHDAGHIMVIDGKLVVRSSVGPPRGEPL